VTVVGNPELWAAALQLAERNAGAPGAVDLAVVGLCVQLHGSGVEFDEAARRIRAVAGRVPNPAELSAVRKLTRPTVATRRPVGRVQ